MEIESLFAVISPDAPCGMDLEYEPDFMALQQAASGKAEHQFGQTVVPAVEPNWDDVRQRAQALFSRTKDLRVAIPLARALARSQDMVGLNMGLLLLHGLLERYWDHLHPRLDTEESDDPAMRLNLNALAPLTDPEAMLREVRTMYLIRSGPHKVLVKDILVALGKLPAGANAASQGQVEATIQAAAKDNAPALEAVRSAQKTANQLHALLIAKVGAERAPDLRPLTDVLKAVVQMCDKAAPASAGEPAASEIHAYSAAAAAQPGGEIRTREDVIHVLDRVCEFMERTEPAHPASLFIRRAQRLMSKNFVEIIQDLAPDSLKIIQQLTGLEKK